MPRATDNTPLTPQQWGLIACNLSFIDTMLRRFGVRDRDSGFDEAMKGMIVAARRFRPEKNAGGNAAFARYAYSHVATYIVRYQQAISREQHQMRALDRPRRSDRRGRYMGGIDCVALEGLIRQERLAWLQEAIWSLPPAHLAVVALHGLDGLPKKRLSVTLGFSPQWAERYWHEAVAMLLKMHSQGRKVAA